MPVSPEVPDANDTEFYDNVISPLATGKYFEACIMIRHTPETELEVFYQRAGEVEDGFECAHDFLIDGMIAVTSLRRAVQHGEDDE